MSDRVLHLRVEAEVDGRLCGTRCRLMVGEDDRGNDAYCSAFGSIRRLKKRWDRYWRNPDCIRAEREACA